MKLKVKRNQANLLVTVIKLPGITQQDGHGKIAPDLSLLSALQKFRAQSSVAITALLQK
jgi:hypothetical protein